MSAARIAARVAACGVALLLATASALAAVPHEEAVPAYAEEQTILQLEHGLPEPGLGSAASGRRHGDRHWLIPIGRETESDLILQRGGNTWRVLRNGPLALASGFVLLLVPLVLLAVWRFVGPAKPPPPSAGPRLLRFSRWRRWVHWTVAISFILLAVTGLLVLFGKQLLIPLIGHTAFSWVAIVSKYVHNVVGPFFILASVLMFLAFVRDNFFARSDWQWMKKGGGLLSHEHVPAGYFNAGEKLWFWFGVVILGLVMSISGLVLNFANFGATRYMMQIANYLHLAGGTLYMAAALGHIYIGTLGTPGAYDAMRHGTVDANWARAHHRLWYDQVAAGRTEPPPALPRNPGTVPGAGEPT